MYSTLWAPPTPVARSRLVISRQMRCPRLNAFAVAMISIAYSLIAPGVTGFCASRVSGCHGRHDSDRLESSARWEALSQPRVSSRSCKFGGTSRSPSRAVCTPTSGPTSLRMTIQLVSSLPIFSLFNHNYLCPILSNLRGPVGQFLFLLRPHLHLECLSGEPLLVSRLRVARNL